MSAFKGGGGVNCWVGVGGRGKKGGNWGCWSCYSSALMPLGWRVLSLLIQNDSRLRIVGRCLLWMTSMPVIVRSLMV